MRHVANIHLVQLYLLCSFSSQQLSKGGLYCNVKKPFKQALGNGREDEGKKF